MEDMSICGLSVAANLGGAAEDDALPQHALNVPEPDKETHSSRAAAEADLRKNYRRHIQRALRSVKSGECGFVNSDMVSLKGLTCLPSVSLKGIGRVALPLVADNAGTSKDNFVSCFYMYSRWLKRCGWFGARGY
jgi:hypothetical protein